ncbi:MAG TPA: lytic transglycosylase domain-containing protein [Candidatus Binataceae bacterium]|nr:lytic transglycosylase domain-containing protein [Candidatus Binataceae bacterium]
MILRISASMAIVLAATLGSGGAIAQAQERPLDQHALFRAVAGFYNLDPALLEAIATVESRGNAEAVSPKGAQGLMQLMPATARRFRVQDPFDPVDNALGAARFLDHLRRWQQSKPGSGAGLPEFLAAYNAGEGAVDKYHGVPPYPETQEYVRRVLIEYLFGPPSPDSPEPERAARPHPAPRPLTPRRLTAAEADRSVLEQLSQLRQSRALAASGSAEAPPR